MALRNQPYIPLYVQDFLTDEKLNCCSASSQGVYIKIMCVLHKQEEYGCLNLFKQKDKQNSSMIINFASKLSKQITFDEETIKVALSELVEEGVLTIDGDKLYQKRMVKDNTISELRSLAGKKGGGNPVLFKQEVKQDLKQTDKQNTEYENEYENVNNKKENKGVKGEKEITWRTDFETYKKELWSWFDAVTRDKVWILEQEKFNPNLDILLTIEKSIKNFWITEAGWKNKKSRKSEKLDWKQTFAKTMDINKVYKARVQETKEPPMPKLNLLT